MFNQVSTGWQHVLVRSGNGRLYSCGWGGSMGDGYAFEEDQGAGGQLGVGDDLDRGQFTAVTLLQVLLRHRLNKVCVSSLP